MEFTFSLPFHLLLPDGNYEVKTENGEILALKLQKTIPKTYDERIGLRGLMESDLKNIWKIKVMLLEDNINGNRINEIAVQDIPKIKEYCVVRVFVKQDGTEFDTSDNILLNAEIPNDRLGRFRYTKVTLTSDTGNNIIERAFAAINKLIDCYRLASGEYWIHRIKKSDLAVFQANAGTNSPHPTIKFQADLHGEDLTRFKTSLLRDSPQDTFYNLFMDAQSALEEENYPLAVIYSVTSIESITKLFLNVTASRYELSKNSIDRLLQMHLSELFTVVLRLILTPSDLPDTIITEVSKTNTLRNKIIHEAKFNVSRTEAQQAVNSASRLIGILLPKIIDLLNTAQNDNSNS